MATGLMVQLGLCIGAIVSMPEVFGTNSHWWLIYVSSGVILIIALIILPLIHESPM